MDCGISLHSIFYAWLTEIAAWRERPATLWDYQASEDGRAGSFLATKEKKPDDRQNQILIDFPLVMCPWSLCKGAVLENVMGFLKVIPKILKLLAENLPQ